MFLYFLYSLVVEGGGVGHANRLELEVGRRAPLVSVVNGRKSLGTLLGTTLVDIKKFVVGVGRQVLDQPSRVLVVV